MGDVAGSGGYYIAMGAKKIYAAPGTLTGSIGVIGGKLVTRGLYDKLGLNTEVIARGAEQRRDVVEPAVHARRAEGLARNAARTRTVNSSARPRKAGK